MKKMEGNPFIISKDQSLDNSHGSSLFFYIFSLFDNKCKIFKQNEDFKYFGLAKNSLVL